MIFQEVPRNHLQLFCKIDLGIVILAFKSADSSRERFINNAFKFHRFYTNFSVISIHQEHGMSLQEKKTPQENKPYKLSKCI